LSDRLLYDEYGEALIEDPTTPEAMAANNGTGVVGDFLGRQNVAVNLVVPEPGTVTLLIAGAIGLLGYGWRRRRGAKA
jgi:hypothetical protein